MNQPQLAEPQADRPASRPTADMDKILKPAAYLAFILVALIAGLAVAYFNGYLAWPAAGPEEPLAAAIAEFERAIELEPANAEAYSYLGQAYRLAGQPERAVAMYRQAIAANPEQAWPYLGLADFYAEDGRTDLALEAYQQGIAAEPDAPAAYLALAAFYREQGEYEQALAAARQAAEVAGDANLLGQAYQEQGLALQGLGATDEALAQFLRAVEAAPESAWFRATLAGFYLWPLNQPGEAVRHYQQVVQLAPTEAWIYEGLGRALQAAGRRDEALQALEQAVALDPNRAESHLALAAFYREQGEYERSLAAARQALELAGDDTLAGLAHYELGLTYQAQQDNDEALAQFLQAVKAVPANALYQATLAELYQWGLSQPERAIPYYERALELSPGVASWYASYGQALLTVGRKAEATDILGQAVGLAGQDIDIYLTVAGLAAQQKEWSSVVTIYERALARDVASADIYLGLGDGYWYLNQIEDAVAAYDQAAALEPGNREVQKRLEMVAAQREGSSN